MDRLVVDTTLLREAGSALRTVALEFNAANARSEDFAEAIGHRGLAGAVREFAHNWDDRRARMAGEIAQLAAATTATAETVEFVDRSLGRALHGLPPIDIATGAPLPASEPARPVIDHSLSAARPIDWTPLARHDAVPGDPAVVRQAGAHYTAVAEAITCATAKLRAIDALESMQSLAVAEVRRRAAEVAASIERAHRRYAETGAALTVYAPEFESAQRLTVDALRQAQAAADLIARAAAQADAAEALLLADPVTGGAQRASAQLLAEDGARMLQLAHSSFGRALEDHAAAARRAERAVNAGRERDGLGDDWRDDFRGAMAPVLKLLAGFADTVAAVTGIGALLTFWCPPLSAALGGIATWAAAASLAAKVLLLLLGEGGVMEVVVGAVTLATFAVGKIAVDAFRVSAVGTRASAWIAASSWARQPAAVRAAAGLPADVGYSRAVRAMMGSQESFGARATAQAFVDRAMREGRLPSTSAAWRTLRELPGRTWDDVAQLRPSQMRTGFADFKAAGGFGNPLNLAGEAAAAKDRHLVDALAAGIREQPAVSAVADIAATQARLAVTVGTAGGALTGWEAYQILADAGAPDSSTVGAEGSRSP